MSTVAELVLVISGKNQAGGALKSAKNDVGALASAVNKLNSTAGGLSKGLGGIASAAGALGKAASVGVVGLGVAAVGAGVGILKLAGNASTMNESLSKARVVFGESSKSIEAFAETSTRSMGLSKQATLEAAGTFGNLLVAIGLTKPAAADMSKGMVKLASDLASFNNIPTADALEKLRAGLVGEAEPLRALGVNMNEAQVKAAGLALGLANANGEMTEGAKVQARYALIMAQTKTAQGDFARTSAGLANQIKILKAGWADLRAELGAKVLPVATKITSWASREGIPMLRALGKVIQSEVVPRLKEFAKTELLPRLKQWGTALKEHLPGAINATVRALAAFVNGVATTVRAVTAGFAAISQTVVATMNGVATVVSAIGKVIYTALQWLNPFASHSPPLVDQVREGMTEIIANFARLKEVEGDLAGVAGSVRGFTDSMAGAAASLDSADLAGKLDDIRRTGGSEAATAFSAASGAVQSLKDKYNALGPALEAAKTKFGAVEAAMTEINDKISETKAKFDELAGTPLLEEKQFTVASKAIQRQMDQIRLAIAKLKQQGPLEIEISDGKGGTKTVDTAIGKSVKALERQLEQLGFKADEIDLSKSLQIDPLKDKLDELTDTAPLPFATIYTAMLKAKKELEDLTAKQQAAQGPYDEAKRALDEQATAYDTLGKAIEGQVTMLDTYADKATEVVRRQDAMVAAAQAAAKALEAAVPDMSALDGIDLTGGLADATASIDDAMTNIDQSMQKASKAFADAKLAFDQVKGSFIEFKASVNNLLDSLGPLWKNFVTGLGVVKDFAKFVIEHKPLLVIAILAIGIALASALGPGTLAILAIIGLITLIGYLKNTFGGAVSDMLADGAAFRDGIVGAVRSVVTWVQGNWPIIATIISGPFFPLVALATDAFGVRSALVGAFNGVTTFLGTWAGNTVSFFAGLPGQLASAFGAGFDFLWQAFRSSINAIIRGWNGLSFSIPGFDPPGPGPKIPGITINTPNIPLLALGGRVERGSPYIVGDGGRPELFIPDDDGRVLPRVPGGKMGRAGSGNDKGRQGNVQVTMQNVNIYTAKDAERAAQDIAFVIAASLRARGLMVPA